VGNRVWFIDVKDNCRMYLITGLSIMQNARGMKFWQLLGIFRDEQILLTEVFGPISLNKYSNVKGRLKFDFDFE